MRSSSVNFLVMPGVQQHLFSGDRCSCFQAMDITPKYHRLEPLEHFPSMNSCKLSSPRDAAANFQRLRSFSFSESEGALPPENFLYGFPMVSSLPRGVSDDSVAALQKFLPSNNEEASWPAVDADEFRMYEFKVRRCTRGRAHDWTECPFAHPGEKARRRDPRKFHYSGTGCPDLRKGSCRRGDACEFAHGVFECWLHPARYRTQPCKDGRSCRRRVCFFAHTLEQLRLLPGASHASNFGHKVLDSCTGGSYDGSPLRYSMNVASFEGDFYDGGGGGGGGGGGLGLSVSCGGHSVSSPPFLYKTKVDAAAQISSPTSTLVGLSPPASPPGSPPPSLDGSRTWPTSAFSAAYPGTSLKAAAYPPKAESAPNPNNRGKNASEYGLYDPSAVGRIMNSLQQMDLNRGPQHRHFPTAIFDESGKGSSTTAVNAAWEDPFSGKDVRAMIYARLGKEASSLEDGNECPDLTWVNELVM